MASEDLFAEELTEETVPDFDNEIEEVTEEVEAIETDDAEADVVDENEKDSTQKEGESSRKTDKPSATADHKLFHLPLARIRNIMKLDPDLHIASNEAVFCVTRATELFIGSIARESYNCTTQIKKKTIQRRDVDNAINTVETLEFLDGAMF